MMNKITESSLLFDFYGNLLTKRKREVMMLYHEENCSLSEIADEFQISRAAVYDSLRKAEQSLFDYEEKLGFLNLFLERQKQLQEIKELIENDGLQNEALKNKLLHLIDNIE